MKKLLIAILLFFTHTIQTADGKKYNTFDSPGEVAESDTSRYYQLAAHVSATKNKSNVATGYQQMNKPSVNTDNSTVDGSNAGDSDKDSPISVASITPPSLISVHEEDTQKKSFWQRFKEFWNK